MSASTLLPGQAPMALIVYAHPEPRLSFNAAMCDVARETLQSMGYRVVVEDLYARHFDAVAGPGDFLSRSDSARFGLVHEQRHASETGGYGLTIRRAQAMLSAASVVLLQFPYWWYGPPAILKGWFDRVLTFDFAYNDGAQFESGLLRGRKALVAMTTGGTRHELQTDEAITGSVEQNLRPILGGVLRFVGMEVAPPYVAYAPASLDHAGRTAMLDAYVQHLLSTLSPTLD
jgi:NAD(P)H dehydrogenase (quinone)